MTICLNRKVMERKSLVIAIYLYKKDDVFRYESNNSNITRCKTNIDNIIISENQVIHPRSLIRSKTNNDNIIISENQGIHRRNGRGHLGQ